MCLLCLLKNGMGYGLGGVMCSFIHVFIQREEILGTCILCAFVHITPMIGESGVLLRDLPTYLPQNLTMQYMYVSYMQCLITRLQYTVLDILGTHTCLYHHVRASISGPRIENCLQFFMFLFLQPLVRQAAMPSCMAL